MIDHAQDCPGTPCTCREWALRYIGPMRLNGDPVVWRGGDEQRVRDQHDLMEPKRRQVWEIVSRRVGAWEKA